jgi:DNA (cytosine-5)-methyltransferase 1
MNKIKLATVFSGIGAIEQAFKRLKLPHSIVFACDNDKFVKQSYLSNYYVSEENWFNDIHNIDGKIFKNKIDILVGGSPCQSFSMVGKRKGLEDFRGLLVYEFMRLIKEIKPTVFIFENVKGLLSHDSGKTWEVLSAAFVNLGYSIHQNVLNSKDFGIPQNRERLFVVGFKKRRSFEFPKPIPLEIVMQDLLEDVVEDKYFLPEKGIKFVTDTKNLNKKYTQINGTVALCQKANQQFNWHGDFVASGSADMNKYYLSDSVKNYVLATGTKDFYSKPKTDLEVARPLLSTMSKMHRAGVDNYITRGEHLRKLTPRECLRLMGFPDDFKIVVSDTQMYKQAGNSIVVDVLINILLSIYAENHIEVAI